MPGPNRRRKLAVCIRVTVIISLLIATVTAVTATLLYVVFGRPTSETSMPVHDLGNYPPVAKTREVSRERLIPENRSVIEYLQPNRRSMNGRPLASTGIRMPLADDGGIHDMSASRNRHANNHRYDSSDGGIATAENYDITGVTIDAETQQDINRQINYIDYSNLETDNWTTEKDGSPSYHDSLDLTYNMGDYGNKQTDDLAGINEIHRDPGVNYSTIYGPYNSRPSGSQPITDHQPLSTDYKLPSKNYLPPTTNYQLPSTNYQLPSTNYQLTDMNYQPTDILNKPISTSYNPSSINFELPKTTGPQNPIPQGPQQKIEIPIPNTNSVVDWRLVGILSLIKLGIVKLKSIAIIKILLFLLFNLKLLLITVFFKFLILLKFFKAMMLPFLFVPLFFTALTFPLILSSLISIPGRIIRYFFTPNNATSQPSNITPSLPGNMMPSRPSNFLPSLPGNTRPSIPGLLPGVLSPSRPSNSVLPASFTRLPSRPSIPSLARLLDQFLPNNNGTPSTKSNTVHLPYGWHSESFEASYPIMDYFWKIIDSEKCMERIACRMAVTEESDTMPVWINWVMRGVSKFIPNKKLESYFKTYDEINNEVLTSSSMRTPDNWNTWCLEHYNCKITNVTHVKDV